MKKVFLLLCITFLNTLPIFANDLFIETGVNILLADGTIFESKTRYEGNFNIIILDYFDMRFQFDFKYAWNYENIFFIGSGIQGNIPAPYLFNNNLANISLLPFSYLELDLGLIGSRIELSIPVLLFSYNNICMRYVFTPSLLIFFDIFDFIRFNVGIKSENELIEYKQLYYYIFILAQLQIKF